ncbi:MAG: hypothetical protein AB7I36_17205 [Rhodospirillaceae bacterium]
MARMLLRLSLTAGILVSAFMAAPAMSASAPPATGGAASEAHRDARELFPATMIGPWKADIEASTYAGSKPRVALRTFAYTEGGRVLVTFMTVGANGAYSTGHWAAQADGTPGTEYHSAAGSIPYNVVSLKKVNETTLNLTVSRHGKVSIEAVYTISEDGKTLTYTYGGNKIVYRRWDKLD